MKLELHRRADGTRCRISYEGAAVEVVTEPPGGRPRTRRKEHRDGAAGAAAARKELAKLVDQDFVAAELGGVVRPVSDFDEIAEALGPLRRDSDEHVLVIEGDCLVPHDLALDFRRGLLAGHEEVPAGVYVTGDLRVAGCIVNWENDYGPFLRVDGSVHAEAVATGGSEIFIGGDLVVAREIVGVYNHGCVRVRGDVRARAIATEHTVEAGGALDAMRTDGRGMVYRVEGKRTHADDPHELRGVFAKALIREQRLQMSEARRQVARGRPIALPSFTSVRAHARKLFGKKLESPEKVKTISLKLKNLTSLPDEIFEFPNLRRLELTHNSLRALPAEIGRLARLEELLVRGNQLRRLPEEIGELVELRVLDVSYNHMVELPAQLARCRRLEHVDLTNNPCASVSRHFGGWRNVELMWTFPEVLAQLPQLRKLRLEQTCIRTLPGAPFASTVLEPTPIKSTLIPASSPAHPQLEVDTASSVTWAVNHVGYWFTREHLVGEARFDPGTKRYDWADAAALLALLLEIVIPLGAPYEAALEKFAANSAHLVWYHRQGLEHVRELFAVLADALERCASKYPANALIDGLRELFVGHTSSSPSAEPVPP